MADTITTQTGSMEIKAADGSGSFKAHTVIPSNTPTGVVVVIQEIFGVNDALRATCQEIGEMGFIAVAPDLFWRLEPGVDITDKTEAEWQKAFDLMNRFDQDKGVEDLKTTVAAARKMEGGNGKVATVGFCLGGRLAAMMATRSDADLNISYYGVALDNLLPEFGNIKHKLLLHIADQDEFFPKEGRDKVVEATKGQSLVESHVYKNVGHAFARVNGVHYDRRAATIANGRTAEALVAAIA